MKLEYQVCSLEYAKRLKELKVKQNSLFNWVYLDKTHPLYCVHIKTQDVLKLKELEDGKIIYGRDPYEKMLTEFIHISAFTVAELGEILPSNSFSFKDKSGWYMQVISPLKEWMKYYPCVTEANARARMLIHLLENGLMKNE